MQTWATTLAVKAPPTAPCGTQVGGGCLHGRGRRPAPRPPPPPRARGSGAPPPPSPRARSSAGGHSGSHPHQLICGGCTRGQGEGAGGCWQCRCSISYGPDQNDRVGTSNRVSRGGRGSRGGRRQQGGGSWWVPAGAGQGRETCGQDADSGRGHAHSCAPGLGHSTCRGGSRCGRKRAGWGAAGRRNKQQGWSPGRQLAGWVSGAHESRMKRVHASPSGVL